MEFLGKIGIFSPTNNRARKYTMILALLSTIVGWSFLIFADFSISTQYNLIEAAQFNYGSISVRTNLENFDEVQFTTLSLGLRAVAWTRSNATFNPEDVDYGTDIVTERIVTILLMSSALDRTKRQESSSWTLKNVILAKMRQGRWCRRSSCQL
jgi:hypothetical protein